MEDLIKMNWVYGGLPKLKARTDITEEEKRENAKRLSEWIASWEKFEQEYPEIAKNLVAHPMPNFKVYPNAG